MMREQRVSRGMVLSIILLAPMLSTVAFVPAPTFCRSTARIQSTTSSSEELPSLKSELFPDATILEFSLDEHKPLGCTVEESLAHPKEKHVFVSKLVDDGFAQAAGLQVGDVLLAVPGIFGDLTDVVGLGIEQVKSLVSGRDESEPLLLRVARGANVMEDHEAALVEMCMTPGANDKEVEECVTTIMAGMYIQEEDEPEMMDCDDEDECLLDAMYSMWDEDMPSLPKPQVEKEETTKEEETIAPWSSRSSPSGTYTRDPATGEMKRI